MKKKFKFDLFLTIVITSIIIGIISLNTINKIVMPLFSNYVTSELKNIIITNINNTIKEEINSNVDYESLMIISKNNNNEIYSIDFNSKEVNKTLTNINSNILKKINKIELNDKFKKNNLFYEVPIGAISENIFLSNMGPSIPIKYKIIGHGMSNINTSIKEYGINNALLTISIITNITLEVNVPFIKKQINIESESPIILKIIQGSIPKYYGGVFSKESLISTIPNF